MVTKQLTFNNYLNTHENSIQKRNGRSNIPDMSDIITKNETADNNHIGLRLQELTTTNVRMKKRIKQQTKELTEVVATNNKFISIIAHDLRGPLSNVLMALDVIQEKPGSFNNNDLDTYIDIASVEANRTLKLLNSLLEWAILQNREKTFIPVKINLHELVSDEIESIYSLAEHKEIALNNFIAPYLNATADLMMVKTILRNLLGNAIKYTGKGGVICISAQEREPFIEIEVRDTGTGITYANQNKLFKKGQLQSTNGTNNEKGSGLGLMLCKEFVEIHGGNISIESEPGNGSLIKFTLPHYI